MYEMNKVKLIHEKIEIPVELNDVVQKAIKQAEKRKKGKRISMKKNILYKCGVAVAAVFIITIAGVNTNEAFAKGLQEIPVIGMVAKVFTFHAYETNDNDKKVKVEIPAVQQDEASKDDKFITDVNAEIKKVCDTYVKEAEKRVAEYKEAFIATGGTEEEFAEKNIKINVDYNIMNQTDDYLSFVVYASENWVSGYAETVYYNLDLKNNVYVTLKDMLGEDYINIANNSIKEQIKKLEEDKNNVFFSSNKGGFVSIDNSTNFYINEVGNPVIVFEKYEIAPGSMGSLEFEIAK